MGTLDQKSRTFLQIIEAMGGQADAGDERWHWMQFFCNDGTPGRSDTFNFCIENVWLRSTHDSDTDHSVAYITEAGRAAIATPAQPEDETSNHVQDIAARAVVYQCAECVRAEHEFCCYPAEQVFIIGGEVFCTECAKSRGAEPRKKVPNLAEKLKRQRGSVRSADLRAEAAEAESARLRVCLADARETALQDARSAVRQALVDVAHELRGDHKINVSSAMFKAEQFASNSIGNLLAALSGEPYGKL